MAIARGVKFLDQKFGPSHELSTPAELKDKPKPRSKGEVAIQYLAELRFKSKDVNDLVIDLARCLGAEI